MQKVVSRSDHDSGSGLTEQQVSRMDSEVLTHPQTQEGYWSMEKVAEGPRPLLEVPVWSMTSAHLCSSRLRQNSRSESELSNAVASHQTGRYWFERLARCSSWRIRILLALGPEAAARFQSHFGEAEERLRSPSSRRTLIVEVLILIRFACIQVALPNAAPTETDYHQSE